MSIESRSRQYGKVFDHWQIKEFLGSGSGGKTAVFRLARSDSGWGTSALKVINLIEERGNIDTLSDYRKREYEYAREECSKNAEQEVRLMDDLRGNTNIVDYLDHTFVDWSDDSGFGRDLLIRMELLKDLRSEIRNGKMFTEREVLKIGRDICVALIRCHRKNILHRDVKPENIFRNKDGDYKLGDFGVSRVLDACPGAVASTGIGTYEYWPAEQMTGRYDKRVDIYSLGLVLYELCNQNHLPFATSTYATSKEVSMRLAGEPLPSPSSASAMLARVILKACAFDPDERYQTAEELLKALNHVIRNIQETATPREIPQAQKSVPGRDNYATEAAGEANRFISQGKDNVYKTEYASAEKNPRRGSFETQPTRKNAYYETSPAEKRNQNTVSPKVSSRKNKSLIMISVAAVGVILFIGGMLGFLFFNNKTEDASLTMAESTIESTTEDLPVDHSETSLATEVETTTGVVEAELLGVKYGVETTEIDLAMLTSADVDKAIEELELLPNLAYVNLVNDESDSGLTKTDVKNLKDALPNVTFNYMFDFFGTTISTEDENVEIKSVFIGDEKASEIRLALDLMNHCNRFVLDNCQMSNEVMAQIREDYRDQTKVVWNVRFGAGETLTDAEVIRAVYDLTDENCSALIYCEDAIYLDISHNENLKTVEFVSEMSKLEVAIISGNAVRDLSPFSNCKELRVLEAAFCEYIENIHPLANCEKLQMLNISNTHVLDLSPLDHLPLSLMCHRLNPSGRSRVPAEEQARFISQHPNCWASFDGAQPYGDGWRYDSNNNPLDWYSDVRTVFKYSSGNVPNNIGWYLDNTTQNDFYEQVSHNPSGFVESSGGFKYTGKIIRANEVNVRANPSTSAEKNTSLKNGSALVIYETTVNEDMAWGRCDAGWIYLYYVDLTPVANGAVDARIIYNDNTIIYTDANCNGVVGTYSRMSVVDIYEISGKMAHTDLGWVNTDNLL